MLRRLYLDLLRQCLLPNLARDRMVRFRSLVVDVARVNWAFDIEDVFGSFDKTKLLEILCQHIREVVALYARRLTIEENFRDIERGI